MAIVSADPTAAFDRLRIDGELGTDIADRIAVADDFGHAVRRVPLAVLRPRSPADIATVVRFANDNGLSVAPRGRGHATGGQAQVSDGIVVDMCTLSGVSQVRTDRAVVAGGTLWRAVVDATVRRGRTPVVLTDYLDLTVGATLAAGGISGASHRCGTQVDHVLELEVVTGLGEVLRCAPDHNRSLFHAVLAGRGQCGIITEAVLRLVPAPPRTRFRLLPYADVHALIHDQRRIAEQLRFDHIEGHAVLEATGTWHYLLGAASFHDGTAMPDDARLLADLTHNRAAQRVHEMSYVGFLNRLDPYESQLRATGEWHDAHPWWGGFLPDSVTDDFVADVMAAQRPADIGASGSALLFPVGTTCTAPLLRLPDEPTAFHFALQRTIPADDKATLTAMTTANRALYERMRAVGGTEYPVGTVPVTPREWPGHYGAAWPDFVAAKQRHDPRHVLTPGQGVFGPAEPGVRR
jgi:FAD/FMN-containing dehydrogenase